MTVTPEFREHVLDLFAGLGPVQVRRMFGGAGVYLGDACFALLIGDVIYLRGDDDTGPAYEDGGGEQWVYDNGKRGPVAMPYWSLPESALDDPEEAAQWARRALVPAEAAATAKRAAKERRKARQGDNSGNGGKRG